MAVTGLSGRPGGVEYTISCKGCFFEIEGMMPSSDYESLYILRDFVKSVVDNPCPYCGGESFGGRVEVVD